MRDPFVAEVFELHQFLQAWLKGEACLEKGPDRLARALAEDFTIVHPNGVVEGKPEVVESFSAAYGSKGSDYALEISDVRSRRVSDRCRLVTYREDHWPEDGRARMSTALLGCRDDRITWIFLQETLISRLL